MSAVEERNEEIVKNFFATLSTGDLEKLRLLLHEEASWSVMGTGIPGAGEKKGHRAIIDDFLRPARGAFVDGDPKVSIDRMICKGPFVAVEARGIGRLKNGKPYANRYAFFVEVKNGKVYALREYMDSYYVSTLV